MPLGAFRLNSLAIPAAEDGGITETTLFRNNTLIDGVRTDGYGGHGPSQITIHGVFNEHIVGVVTWLNSARSNCYITPFVIDCSDGSSAAGSNTNLGTMNTSVTNGFSVAAKPGSTYGMVVGPVWVSSHWDGKFYGYTLSGTSTASTSNVPTLTLSTAATDTENNFFAGNLTYAGKDDAFLFHNRYGSSDFGQTHLATYSGSGTPSIDNTSTTASGSRATGMTVGFTDGTASNDYISFTNQVGNNANFADLVIVAIDSSNHKKFSDQSRLDCSPSEGVSGGSFTAAKAWDTSSEGKIGISGIYSSQESQKLQADKITAGNPTTNITITEGAVLSPSDRLYTMDTFDDEAGTARGLISTPSGQSGTYLCDYDVNSSTLAITATPFKVDDSGLFYTNMASSNLRNFSDATQGDWTVFGYISSTYFGLAAIKVV